MISAFNFSAINPNIVHFSDDLLVYTPRAVPSYQPDLWNHSSLVDKVNCFTYALNLPDHGWGQPGDLRRTRCRNRLRRDVTFLKMNRLLCKEGLLRISEQEALGDERLHVFAMVVSRGYDYHFFRKDKDCWSHKLSDGPIQEFSYEYIGALSDSLGYDSRNIGYYAVPDEGVIYCPRLRREDSYENNGVLESCLSVRAFELTG